MVSFAKSESSYSQTQRRWILFDNCSHCRKWLDWAMISKSVRLWAAMAGITLPGYPPQITSPWCFLNIIFHSSTLSPAWRCKAGVPHLHLDLRYCEYHLRRPLRQQADSHPRLVSRLTVLFSAITCKVPPAPHPAYWDGFAFSFFKGFLNGLKASNKHKAEAIYLVLLCQVLLIESTANLVFAHKAKGKTAGRHQSLDPRYHPHP